VTGIMASSWVPIDQRAGARIGDKDSDGSRLEATKVDGERTPVESRPAPVLKLDFDIALEEVPRARIEERHDRLEARHKAHAKSVSPGDAA